jgi:ABC-type transport system involved in multi-copper enzyme maturation permease subunit
MILTIVAKEIREILSSRKFLVAFAVCSALILIVFASAATSYHALRREHEAAVRDNLKQFEGLTDWQMVQRTRVFLPPDILSTLVTGIANDIGRTIEVSGRGDLEQDGSRHNSEPMLAVFQAFDLTFVVQIVLSLFALLFAYDAVSGERERGTLALSLSNAVPRAVFLTGKILGTVLGLGLPLVVPFLLGPLILVLMNVPMDGGTWLRLGGIIGASLLFFAVMVVLSVAVSAMTARSSTSFLILLVAWTLGVVVLPRAALLIAGRMVDVPTLDDIAAQKARLSRQLWTEDRERINAFHPSPGVQPQKAMEEFSAMMSDVSSQRNKKLEDLSARLFEERANRRREQSSLALGLARLSPASSFTLAATASAGTSPGLADHYLAEAKAYQQTFGAFLLEKTGRNPGSGMFMRIITIDGEKPKPINPQEIPPFTYHPEEAASALGSAGLDVGLLAFFGLAFFAAAHAAFLKYDVR